MNLPSDASPTKKHHPIFYGDAGQGHGSRIKGVTNLKSTFVTKTYDFFKTDKYLPTKLCNIRGIQLWFWQQENEEPWISKMYQSQLYWTPMWQL
ncbi:unnamed protein product [Absidia cylindrospora]